MVVYADILVCVNLIVNYALLLTAGHFCRRTPHRVRILAAALVGALYALLIFAVGLPRWVPPATKLLVGGAMVLLAFPYRGMAELLRQCIIFLLVSFVFGGLMLALWLFAAPSGMLYDNGVVYFDISALKLVGFTAVAYGFTELFARLYHKRDVENGMVEVTLILGNRQEKLMGFVDTGNTLRDAYTGYPVAVCTLEAVYGLLPTGLLDIVVSVVETEDFSGFQNLLTPNTKNKFKLIPYSTVGFSGVLPAFLPDELRLNGELAENIYVAVAPKGFAHSDYDLLLSPEMLPAKIGEKPRTGKRGAKGKKRARAEESRRKITHAGF